jgi:uncharacterized protein
LPALKIPSFLADAMLGSIARKLRIFGFDTLYMAHAHDDDILRTGIEQGRVILTADKELFKRVVKAGVRGVLVSGIGDLEDLVHILSKSGIASVDLGAIGTRCSMCNGLLEKKKLEQVKDGVPGKVAELHSDFYQCTACGKIYWEGGHLRRIRALAKSVDSKLGRAIAI